jgi:hypothetical protein
VETVRAAIVLLLVAFVACKSGAAAPGDSGTATATTAAATPPATATATASEAAAPVAEYAQVPTPAEFGAEEAEQILFDENERKKADECPGNVPESTRIRCLIGLRYRGDDEAAKAAERIWDRFGHVPGIEKQHVMNGGYRGLVKVMPALPVDRDRHHLVWLDRAFADIDTFLTAIAARAEPGKMRYRWRALALRFCRTPHATSPGAFAIGWNVSWNVAGALHTSAEAVRETTFHEIFHLNDAFHGLVTLKKLAKLQEGIRARCGVKVGHPELATKLTECLEPYTPNYTKVPGGTYYAFHPPNDAQEYGGEIAVRYLREQSAMLRGEKLDRPLFKCGPKESAEAWDVLVKEYWGGVDLTPPCLESPAR